VRPCVQEGGVGGGGGRGSEKNAPRQCSWGRLPSIWDMCQFLVQLDQSTLAQQEKVHLCHRITEIPTQRRPQTKQIDTEASVTNRHTQALDSHQNPLSLHKQPNLQSACRGTPLEDKYSIPGLCPNQCIFSHMELACLENVSP
jgi:hypothetical protein